MPVIAGSSLALMVAMDAGHCWLLILSSSFLHWVVDADDECQSLLAPRQH